MGRLINNDKIANDLNATVQSAKSTMDNVHKTTSNLNQGISNAQNSFFRQNLVWE